MKILFISPSPVWGGASTANLSIAKILDSIGHQVTFVDEYFSDDNYNGMRIEHFPIHKYRFRQNRMRKYISEGLYNGVIWGNYLLAIYYWPTILLLHRQGIKQYAILHSVSLSTSLRSKLFDSIFANTAPFFDRLICVSEYTVKCWSTHRGFVKALDKVSVIHNSVPIPEEFVNKDHDGINIGFVGRFSEEKQPELFCQLSETSEYNYLAWGTGPLLEKMRSAYPKVNYLGQGFDPNVMYSEIDILVLTSKFENCPMVILEAMARGIPCVCPCVGGIPEIVENRVEGILYDNYSSDVIIEGIESVLKDYNRYSANCVKKAAAFFLEPTAKKWESIII